MQSQQDKKEYMMQIIKVTIVSLYYIIYLMLEEWINRWTVLGFILAIVCGITLGITGLGLITCMFSILMIIYSFANWIHGNNIPGYTTSILISLIMGGATLLSLGIIGEYIGKIYLETKNRPRYIIESIVWSESD